MEQGREGDLRVPIISCLFFLFVLTGGILLCLYVFNATISQPWFPIAALALIGSPWIFWFLMYLYTCIKACCRGGAARNNKDRQISRRGNRSIPPSATTTGGGGGATTSTMNCTSPEESQVNSHDDQRHVHFGAVVVMDGEDSRGRNMDGQHDGVGELSVASSTESEMPLTLSVKS